MSDFGVLLVGAGGVGALHLTAVARHSQARLVGVCDVDADRARAAARRVGDDVRSSASLDDALGWSNVHGVIVCTPNDTHVEVGLSVLESGSHLLLEKPIAIDLDGAEALIETAAKAERILMPGHTYRFSDLGLAVRDAVCQGTIGRPMFARTSLLAGWIWGDWSSWVLDPTRSGGHVVHNGVHGLDLVTWWLDDEPVEAFARGHRGTSVNLQIDDHFHIVVRYGNGSLAIVEVGRATRPQTIVDRETIVVGDRGVVRHGVQDGGGLLHTERGTVPLGYDAQLSFDRQLAAWVEAADTGRPAVTGEDSRRALAVALAAQRSIITGQPSMVES